MALAGQLERSRQSKDDILVVVAKPAAEDVDAAGMARVGLDLDPEPNRVMGGNVEILRRNSGNSHPVDECAFRRDAPALELAVLAALELPPVGGIHAPLVAEVAGAGPDADFPRVDRDRDV